MKRAIIIGACVLALSACGGDDSGSGPSETSTTTLIEATTTQAATTVATLQTTTTAATTTTSTTTTLPATTTSTMPPTLTIEEAAAKYLELVAPGNALAAQAVELYEDADGNVQLEDYPAYCAMGAASTEQLAADIRLVAWPVEVQPTATEFANALAAQAGLEYSCGSSTPDGAAAMNQQLQDAWTTSNGLASTMRSLLGLPVDR